MQRNWKLGGALFAVVLAAPSAFALGGGAPFVFREGNVMGANAHPVSADAEDFSYHSCVHFTDADSQVENGYFWVSSYQDAVGVVDSQINDYQPNGYHVYARYRLHADECMGAQPTCNNRPRRSYDVQAARLELFLDPLQDTVLGIANCQVTAAGNADDLSLGFADAIVSGQKTETDDQANGDFDVLFANWAFSAVGQTLYWDGMGAPLAVPTLDFNANVTRLQGSPFADHHPEGSGNFFWFPLPQD
jgi:hypothetical protein